jgi:predicted RNase H-like HicB family nuclease
MSKTRIIFWKEDHFYLGYLVDFPDYWTQGESLEDLKDHLRDLYLELTNGSIPSVRQADELVIA